MLTPSEAAPPGGAVREERRGTGNAVPGATLYLVDGSYDYYHYMQDNFNDNVRRRNRARGCLRMRLALTATRRRSRDGSPM